MSNINVLLRIKPNLEDEINKENMNLKIKSNNKKDSISIFSEKKNYNEKIFNFNKILKSNTNQEKTYSTIKDKLINNSLNGINYCLMAYGQTSSGKTYTLMGDKNMNEKSKNMGIIPRYLENLIEEWNQDTDIQFNISYSYFEIYKENIYDLFSDDDKPLNLREFPQKGIFIDGITNKESSNLDDILNDIDIANDKRQIHETKMNSRSSRSHGIITFNILINELIEAEEKQNISFDSDDNSSNKKELKSKKQNYKISKASKIIFVDLAGSESQNNDNLQDRKKEGCYINKSLSILNHCIMLLAQKKKEFVHYRDSKLTHYLKEVFKGNSNITMVGTILNNNDYFFQTLNTLNFVSLAKQIKTNPDVNIKSMQTKDQLKKQIKELKSNLNKLKNNKITNYNFEEVIKKLDEIKNDFYEFLLKYESSEIYDNFEKIVNKIEQISEKLKLNDKNNKFNNIKNIIDDLDNCSKEVKVDIMNENWNLEYKIFIDLINNLKNKFNLENNTSSYLNHDNLNKKTLKNKKKKKSTKLLQSLKFSNKKLPKPDKKQEKMMLKSKSVVNNTNFNFISSKKLGSNLLDKSKILSISENSNEIDEEKPLDVTKKLTYEDELKKIEKDKLNFQKEKLDFEKNKRKFELEKLKYVNDFNSIKKKLEENKKLKRMQTSIIKENILETDYNIKHYQNMNKLLNLKLDRVNNQNNNFKKQLNKRNKDYLFTLKELQKIKKEKEKLKNKMNVNTNLDPSFLENLEAINKMDKSFNLNI